MVETYLRGQFIASSEAWADILNDPPVTFNRQCPLLFPSWTVTGELFQQGDWRRYVDRVVYRDVNVLRHGALRPIPGDALQLSVIFATALHLLRYFGDDRLIVSTAKTKNMENLLHPVKLTRKNWDDVEDDETHAHFDPVFSELLPGYRLARPNGAITDSWRRQRNNALRFPDFLTQKLGGSALPGQYTATCKYFQSRLFSTLPWMRCTNASSWVGERADRVVSPIPVENLCIGDSLGKMVTVMTCKEFAGGTWPGLLLTAWQDMKVFFPTPEFFAIKPEPPMEDLCRELESAFARSESLCRCCLRDLPQRCPWCANASGWHRCQHVFIEATARGIPLSYADVAAFVWCPGSLYDIKGYDIFRVCTEHLQRGGGRTALMAMLEEQRQRGDLDQATFLQCARVVVARTGGLLDTSSAWPQPNQRYVLERGINRGGRADRETLLADLALRLKEMGNLWDSDRGEYRRYDEFQPARRPPSQLLAFEQLQYRYNHGKPILVTVVAQAGHGKSTLCAAWLAWLATRDPPEIWEIAAPTGIAATQLGGVTLHALLSMDTDGYSELANDPQRLRSFQRISGFAIDEFGMCTFVILNDQFAMFCCQYPLLPSLRRPGALPHFGYRSILLLGDLRQLPPATLGAAQPYWASDSFQRLFEVFWLREDRRHERQPRLHRIKEHLAWGGTDLAGLKSLASCTSSPCNAPWPPSDEIIEYVTEGFLRGWGLSGSNVHLEIGTAIFARRTDVERWNNACVAQIETKYQDSLEAVDVHGYDPDVSSQQSTTDAKRLAAPKGQQTPKILRLRTCPEHRQRLILLHNLDVSNHWANGTRCRLLSQRAWTGECKRLEKPFKKGDPVSCHQVFLENTRLYPEFNLHVIRDVEGTVLKEIRWHEDDVQLIPTRTDITSGPYTGEKKWKQVQAALAYALTGHKSQGLTMDTVYIGWFKIFGFGLPYTMCTRTPWEENLYFVGVPPYDILDRILAKTDGKNLVEHRRSKLETILRDPDLLELELQHRIDIGMFDLPKIAESLRDDASKKNLHGKVSKEELARARDHCLQKLAASFQEWCDRLQV